MPEPLRMHNWQPCRVSFSLDLTLVAILVFVSILGLRTRELTSYYCIFTLFHHRCGPYYITGDVGKSRLLLKAATDTNKHEVSTEVVDHTAALTIAM